MEDIYKSIRAHQDLIKANISNAFEKGGQGSGRKSKHISMKLTPDQQEWADEEYKNRKPLTPEQEQFDKNTKKAWKTGQKKWDKERPEREKKESKP